MKQKKFQLWLPLLLSVMMVVGMVIGYKLRQDTAGPDAFLNNYNNATISEVLNLVKKNYVDNINIDSMQVSAINRILQQLDPYTLYIPAATRLEMLDEKNGYFTGLGISFESINDSVFITDVTKGGPAFAAGIQKGDVLLTLNDSLKLSGPQKIKENVANLIKKLNSPIKAEISRGGEIRSAKIRKALLPSPSIDAAYMIKQKTAYIKLNKFSETTYKEFMYALEMLKREGMQQLIIDLRGNTGGVMTSATEIANEFLKDGQLIVYTQGAKSGKKEYRCKRDGLYTDLKLAVLIDETSASASEVLAGALQDWDRAFIIGRRSFGKGFVENQYKLNNGAALRLTVARYYTPLGRNIQKPYRNTDVYNKKLTERFHNGQILSGDTTAPRGREYKTPKGRIVYGGGGITPDIAIPYDTSVLPQPVVKLYLKNVLLKFSFIYYFRNQSKFANIHSAMQMDSLLLPEKDDIWKSLKVFALKDTVDLSSISAHAEENIWDKFVAFTAENKFGTSGYFEANNRNDEIVDKALETIDGSPNQDKNSVKN